MGEDSQKITLRKKLEDIEIEVQAIGVTDLEKAYISLLNAKLELEKIQLKNRLLMEANQAKAKAVKFLKVVDEEQKIVGVKDTSIAMMLSLLGSYPECKTVTQIASDTGKQKSSVSRYLSGEYGEHTSFFEKCDGDWKLSPDGVYHINEWLNNNTTIAN